LCLNQLADFLMMQHLQVDDLRTRFPVELDMFEWLLDE
jgi:hypothetical protein